MEAESSKLKRQKAVLLESSRTSLRAARHSGETESPVNKDDMTEDLRWKREVMLEGQVMNAAGKLKLGLGTSLRPLVRGR